MTDLRYSELPAGIERFEPPLSELHTLCALSRTLFVVYAEMDREGVFRTWPHKAACFKRINDKIWRREYTTPERVRVALSVLVRHEAAFAFQEAFPIMREMVAYEAGVSSGD